MPPTIFLLSLGGVVVILARGVVRMRRADFSASVKSAAAHTPQDSLWGQGVQSTDADVLRPTQKSVQVIKSRAGLILVWLKKLTLQIKLGVRWLSARPVVWRQNRLQRAAATTVQTQANSSAESTGQENFQVKQPKQKTRDTARRLLQFSSTGIRATRLRLQHTFQRAHSFHNRVSQDIPEKASLGSSRSTLSPGKNNEFPDQSVSDAMPQHTDEPIIPNTNNIRTRIIEKISPDISLTRAAGKSATLKRHQKHLAKKTSTPVQQARQAFADKSYAHAENILVNHIVSHTKDTNAYMLLGEIACAKENYSEAIEIFEQIIAWNPETKGGYAKLGLAAFQAGRYGRALQALQRAHDAEPDNQEVLRELLAIAKRMDNPALQHSIEEKLAARQNASS